MLIFTSARDHKQACNIKRTCEKEGYVVRIGFTFGAVTIFWGILNERGSCDGLSEYRVGCTVTSIVYFT